MEGTRHLLRHFLATLAYRTEKALRDAPEGFGGFTAGAEVRTPHALVRHMSGVLAFAAAVLDGAEPPLLEPTPNLETEAARLRALLDRVSARLAGAAELDAELAERLLQGPLCDAMTHAGQLALLRRLAGSPVPPENFFAARIIPAGLAGDRGASPPPTPDP